LWMGQSAGLFSARGLDVDIVNTDGGSRGLAEVGAGRLEGKTRGVFPVIDPNREGGDFRPIASGGDTVRLRFFGAQGGLCGAALKGKTVGVSAFRSESDSAASLALKQLGLQRSDVKLVEAGGTLRRLDALKGGTIAATALNEPADTEAQREKL